VTIPEHFKELLRNIVFAQDRGVPVFMELQAARFTLSTIDRLMVEADDERSRMRAEGLDVHEREEGKPLIIGLAEKPYKKSE